MHLVVLTGSLPLVFVHLALAVGVNDLHVRKHRSKIFVVFVFGVNFVKFFYVKYVEVVF